MAEKSIIDRSPVRIFERAIGGSLGAGNMGVVLSRQGVGKTAFLIGLAVDHLLQDKKVLYISTQESVDHIREFFEQIFLAMAESLGMDDAARRQLLMERNRQIQVYNRKTFSVEKLEQAAGFLEEAMGFSPDMVVMDGTPRFEHSEDWELDNIKELMGKWGAELWCSSNTHREGQEVDDRGVPNEVARFDDKLAVIVNLVPENDHTKVVLIKEHNNPDIAQVQLEVDPSTMLLRWR
ncbi:MAG: hypothetical protein ACI9UK_002430 [Candidatus Krumholzibacteriia bacterium]|jgi:hypothetical protein